MNNRDRQFELPRPAEQNSNRAGSFELRLEHTDAPDSTILADTIVSSGHDYTLNMGKIPSYLIGLLLTSTAIAKVWMMLTDSFADIRVGLSQEILWLSLAFEFWLAIENFRVRDTCVMAFANTIVFTSFAIFASVRIALGHGSCGCAGSLEIPSWVFLLIDLGVVAWFVGTASHRIQVFTGLRQLAQDCLALSHVKRSRLTGLAAFGLLIICLQLPQTATLKAFVFGEPPIQAFVHIGGELVLNHMTPGDVKIHIVRDSQPRLSACHVRAAALI